MKLNPETDLTFTRIINAPRALVWECWTTPEHIKHFFVPKPHGIDACEIDLRVGGKFNTTMNVWRAPIGWSVVIVSASLVSGPLERCFPALAVDIPVRCAA